MASTQTPPDASALRPWQFFTLLALFAATVAVYVVRGTSPENVILTCLTIGAAALVGIAALRALKPLVSPDSFQSDMIGNRTRAALEREKNLALRAIKELEFDHAMGKIATADYEEMTGRLRARAVRLLKQLDASEIGYREVIERELAKRLSKAGVAPAEQVSEVPPVTETSAACVTCGTSNDSDARFCKQCGTKLLMLVIAVLAFAGTAWAQFQMPDPKQMSGIPRPVTDLPEGHISVRLIRGQLSNNITDFPVELQGAGKVITVKTDENGRAEFSGIKAGTPVKAVAVVDGERLESQEFPAPAEGGIRLMLVATAKGTGAPAQMAPPQKGTVVLGDQTRVILEMEDDTLRIFYLLDFENTARAPVIPPSTIVLDMPREAQGTSILGEGGAQAVVRGSRVTIPGPFPPGQTVLQVGYQFPHSSGDVSVTQKFPLAVGNLAVLMTKIGDMSLSSPQLPQIQERDFQGQKYVLAQGPPQAAGSTLTLNVAGLPHHSPVPRTIALVLAALTAGAGLWAAARAPRRRGDSTRVKQLAAKRDRIFADLVRLEQQRKSGVLDASRYAERRPTLVAQLERVYRDLDTEGGQDLAA